MKFLMLFVLIFLFTYEVCTQDILTDLLQRINDIKNQKEYIPNDNVPDNVNAEIEDTRLKLIRLMRRSPEERSDENWTGRWMPEKITERPRPMANVMTGNNMWQMINVTCDDGHTNLSVDWDMSPINHTCYFPSQVLLPDPTVRGIIERDDIPPAYSARHVCMGSTIEYDSFLPTFGPHRPAWPKYGEYIFVPRQRWLHNLEHGAVVMLYHPCAHPLLIEKLRTVVKNCLYRHVITPYTLLPLDRPLALVTWGWAYLMPDVEVDSVVRFIKEHALQGPEHTSNDGQYDLKLLQHAEVVSTIKDEQLCPVPRFRD